MESSILNYAKQAVNNTAELRKIVYNAGVESCLRYAEPETHISHKIKLLFSPFGLPFVPLEIVGENLGGIIQSFSWQKDRQNPGGMLSVTITPDADAIKQTIKLLDTISGNVYSAIWGKLGADLEDMFKPMTLCQLWVDGYHVMTGTVRSCSRSASAGDTDYSASYNIVIEELGNIYTKQIIGTAAGALDRINAQVMDALAYNAAIKAVDNIGDTNAATALNLYFTAFKKGMLFQGFSGSDGLPLSLRLMSTPNPLGGIANLSLLSKMPKNGNMFNLASGQSFWDFIKNMVNSPWVEFYTESGGRTIVTEPIGTPAILFPGLNYIVCRTTPYSNPLLGFVNPVHVPVMASVALSAIQMLAGGDFVIITDDIISNKTLGVDCSNQATMFKTSYIDTGGSQITYTNDIFIGSVGPMNPLASGGMSTFGPVTMEQFFNALSINPLNTVESQKFKVLAKKISGGKTISTAALSNLLAVWFRNQSRFREGTVTTKLMPWARPGMYCLYLPMTNGRPVENLRDIGIYYIDSLSHDYNLSDDSVDATTTFQLIRGCPLPASLAQTALLLFDWEILPPVSGGSDGEFYLKLLKRIAGM